MMKYKAAKTAVLGCLMEKVLSTGMVKNDAVGFVLCLRHVTRQQRWQ